MVNELGDSGQERAEQWAAGARKQAAGIPKNSLSHGVKIDDFSKGWGCITSIPEKRRKTNSTLLQVDRYALKAAKIEKLTPKPMQRTTAKELYQLAHAAYPENDKEKRLAESITEHLKSGKKKFETGKLKGSPEELTMFLTAFNETMPLIDARAKLFNLDKIYNEKKAQLSENFNKDEILFLLELGHELALQKSEKDEASTEFLQELTTTIESLERNFPDEFSENTELNQVKAEIEELINL